MSVLISNSQNKEKIHLEKVRKTAQAILNALACPDGELSVTIVDDDVIAGMNTQYLNRSGPTNVIAFSMREGEFSDLQPNILGDVVISAETTRTEAVEAEIGFDQRFYELLIHGILHLFGYDHDRSEAEYQRMEDKSEALYRLVEPMIMDS